MRISKNKYVFDLVGKRNGVMVEDVFDFLRDNSMKFNVVHQRIWTTISGVTYNGYGVIGDIEYDFIANFASMGLPNLEIYTKSYSLDKKIREIIHNGTGWKSVKKRVVSKLNRTKDSNC